MVAVKNRTDNLTGVERGYRMSLCLGWALTKNPQRRYQRSLRSRDRRKLLEETNWLCSVIIGDPAADTKNLTLSAKSYTAKGGMLQSTRKEATDHNLVSLSNPNNRFTDHNILIKALYLQKRSIVLLVVTPSHHPPKALPTSEKQTSTLQAR